MNGYVLKPLHDFCLFISRILWSSAVKWDTYIIGHYNPSVRIIDLVSHTTLCCVCVNFMRKLRDLQFKVVAILFTLRAFARDLLRGNDQRNTFCILFWILAWGLNPGFTFNKPTHNLLEHGDFVKWNVLRFCDMFLNLFDLKQTN